MKTKRFFFQMKNKILGTLFPRHTARKTAHLFLTPKRRLIRPWEKDAESACRRSQFGNGLSAARWGNSEKRILVMHGWESRATQLYSLVPDLVVQGFEVIGIDAPAHGQSRGKTANPVLFSKAIREADQAFGPFFGAIGHSMGGAAVAIAMEEGVRFQRVALIASPNNFLDVLKAFAASIGLPERASRLFVKAVEQEAGRPASDLDVRSAFAEINPEALIVHAKNDKEVPYSCLERIAGSCPGAQTYSSETLGHRRIIRSPEISAILSRFMGEGLAIDTSETAETCHDHAHACSI